MDPSDLVQNTLTDALQAIAKGHGPAEGHGRAWLRKILTDNVYDALRELNAGKRDPARERSLHDSATGLEHWLADEGSSPSERAMREELLDRLAAALDGLPEGQRRAVELKHLRGCSVREITAEMGKPEAAVAGLLRRGLIALRERLADLVVRRS